MRLISILFYVVLALGTTTSVDAGFKDLVNKVKDVVKPDIAKILVKPKTKIIALDSNIVPTWNDVVPKSKRKLIKKITLKTVLNRWNKMEKKSRTAYASLVASPTEKTQVIAKVTKFYDGSEVCLKKQGKLTRKVNKTTFTKMMKAVRKCIDDTNAPPTFEVDVDATVPVVVDDGDAESDLDTGGSDTKDDTTGGDGDDTTTDTSDSGSGSSGGSSGTGSAATTPTMAPTEAPTAAPTEAPTEAPAFNSATPEGFNSDSSPGSNVVSDQDANSNNDQNSLTDVFFTSPADNSEPKAADESNTDKFDEFNATGANDTIEEKLYHLLSEDAEKSTSSTSKYDIEESSITHPIVNDELDDQVIYTPYVYNPALAQVAPFSALDVNRDGQVTPNEWPIYVIGLHDAATARVEKGKDVRAKQMIKNVIEFHYSILDECINNNVGTQSLKEDATFQAMVNSIERNCYVKFRYSLLAGPPPFEWVAKRNVKLTPSEIEAWFNKAVNKAKADIKNKRIVTLTHAEQEQVEHVMECIYKVLGTTDSPLNRTLYYSKLDQVGNCVASFTN